MPNFISSTENNEVYDRLHVSVSGSDACSEWIDVGGVFPEVPCYSDLTPLTQAEIESIEEQKKQIRLTELEPYLLTAIQMAQMAGFKMMPLDDEDALANMVNRQDTATAEEVKAGMCLIQAKSVLYQNGGTWQDVIDYSRQLET